MAEFISLTARTDAGESLIFLNKSRVLYVAQVDGATTIYLSPDDVIEVADEFSYVCSMLAPVFSPYTPVFAEATTPGYMRMSDNVGPLVECQTVTR